MEQLNTFVADLREYAEDDTHFQNFTQINGIQQLLYYYLRGVDEAAPAFHLKPQFLAVTLHTAIFAELARHVSRICR